MSSRASVATVVTFLAFACGSESSGGASDGGPPSDAASRTDAADASSDGTSSSETSSDAAACVSEPKIGDACSPGQVSCDRVDPCCAQSIVCDEPTAKWKDSGVACLLCNQFACGTESCAGGSVCLARASGIDGGTTSYACVSMPTACSRNWSCDCVTKNLPPNCTLSPAGGCSEQGVHVTLSCMGS